MPIIAETVGQLGREVAAMRAELQSLGQDRRTIDAAIAKVLRQRFEEREWRYVCTRCEDYGLEILSCPGDATCGRSKPHLPHEFGQTCWCSAAAKFKKGPKPDPESDFQQAGKMPRKPARFGR